MWAEGGETFESIREELELQRVFLPVLSVLEKPQDRVRLSVRLLLPDSAETARQKWRPDDLPQTGKAYTPHDSFIFIRSLHILMPDAGDSVSVLRLPKNSFSETVILGHLSGNYEKCLVRFGLQFCCRKDHRTMAAQISLCAAFASGIGQIG